MRDIGCIDTRNHAVVYNRAV